MPSSSKAASTFAIALLALAPGLLSLPAHASADEHGALALVLDGVDGGYVRATTAGDGTKRMLAIATDEPTAPLLGAVRAFLDGKTPRRSIVLSTSAVLKRANDARLVDVRLPSYAGGSGELVLGFEVGSTSTSPSLRLASDRAKPRGKRLAGFRLALSDLPTREAARLEPVVLRNEKGAVIPGALSFDVPTRDAPALVGWSKRPTPRNGALEYVSATGETVLRIDLAGCTPSSVKLDGPVTHVLVGCARAK